MESVCGPIIPRRGFWNPGLQVAGDAADKIHGGATVIANNPSFFFYLTYILRVPEQGADWKFAGVLPDTVRYPNVMSADEWMASGHPFAPTVIWIRGMADPQTEGPMTAAAKQLDQSCGSPRFAPHDARPGISMETEILSSTWRIAMANRSPRIRLCVRDLAGNIPHPRSLTY